MDADWITSPSARRVLQHTADSRPAWLWSQAGQVLLWQNQAAPLFLAKLKKHGLKLAPPAVPIKGQIARNIRLGSVGRTSLARIQFIAGEKPASSTCATTPLVWHDGQTVLLVVGVDPIAPDVMAAADNETEVADSIAVAGPHDGPVDIIEQQREPENALAVPHADAPVAAEHDGEAAATIPDADLTATSVSGRKESTIAAQFGTADAEVLAAQQALDETEAPAIADDNVVWPVISDDSTFAQELENWRESDRDGTPALELVPATAAQEPPTQSEDRSSEAPTSRLSRLVDRLAADEGLFTPLTEADDAALFASPLVPAPPALFKVTGQGFAPDAIESEPETPLEVTDAEAEMQDLARLDATVEAVKPLAERTTSAPDGAQRMTDAPAEMTAVPDTEAVERVSRYNFDELARILTDRVGESAAPPPTPALAPPTRTGALINLGGETLVLNRLPLGILVFRDQQVLFANRAITEMVGYPSVESLRQAGLAAVFPAAGPESAEDAGPVNHLVQRDGTLVPVTARLQSISWQGKPALMLSASTTEVRTGHEAAVAAFAQSFADLRGDGFFEATRAGVVSAITAKSATLLNERGKLEGKTLSLLVASSDVPELQAFLERPARFAETARPCLTLRSTSGAAEISLFAQGQAGVVTGYFGFVRGRDVAPVRLPASNDADPALLARISRGVRRPLNTIIGFADMLRSQTAGMVENERYESYAQDISTAGQEIAALVDELDDYARLRDGRYLPQRASIELTSLLESCVLRIRQQASGARVIVRNAISEDLPRVTADRASLAQAVLNLLSSAIDQTPSGGGVVISAQIEDDGGIAVHVRDSSNNAVDMAERFVVFRDGVGRDGQMMVPVRSSIGMALTRSLLAVNAFSLSVDPAGEQGMLFTMVIPAYLVEEAAAPGKPE